MYVAGRGRGGCGLGGEEGVTRGEDRGRDWKGVWDGRGTMRPRWRGRLEGRKSCDTSVPDLRLLSQGGVDLACRLRVSPRTGSDLGGGKGARREMEGAAHVKPRAGAVSAANKQEPGCSTARSGEVMEPKDAFRSCVRARGAMGSSLRRTRGPPLTSPLASRASSHPQRRPLYSSHTPSPPPSPQCLSIPPALPSRFPASTSSTPVNLRAPPLALQRTPQKLTPIARTSLTARPPPATPSAPRISS